MGCCCYTLIAVAIAALANNVADDVMAVPGVVIVVADEVIVVSVVVTAVTAVPVVVTTVAVVFALADDIAVAVVANAVLIHCQTVYCNSDRTEGPMV